MFEDTNFWVLVAFVLFVALVWRKAAPAITGLLDARAEKIKNELDEAQRLREEAQSLLATLQRKQREAENDAAKILEHAREEAERMRERASRDLDEALARRRRQAEEKIAQAEASAIASVRDAAIDVAIDAASRVIGERASQGDAGSIDSAIEEVGRRLH